ncbi:glycosyltransferase [Flavobacteriaceae bacterium Ap0902]|nr:glycosyltransferase [Flavobacteriaceae bacterium Ap0902]
MSQKIISLVSNNIATDQRLIKVGTSLKNNGYDFLLIGTQHRGTPSVAHIPFKIKRVSIFFKRNIFFYAELQFRLLFQLLIEDKKNSILLANDLDTLLPAYVVSKMFKIPLVLDSHEIFSELPTLKPGSIQKKVWCFLEKKLIPQVDKMYTVSPSYALFFKNKYGKEAAVVSNFPVLKNNLSQQADLKIAIDKKTKYVLIYQGAINESRGIDKMILAMQYLDDTALWIIGDGPLKKSYQKLAQKENLLAKVQFLGRINPNELKAITPLADLGLSLEEDNGLSYKYALPNKVFDYVHAGIPVLGSSDLPEVKNIINKYKIGDVIKSHDPIDIAKKIQGLLKTDKSIFKSGLSEAQKDLNWENHESILLDTFSVFK